jgi:phospholipid transport system transporter-binding protein
MSDFVAADGGYRLQTALLFGTVPQLRGQGISLIEAASGELYFDLSGVTAADSAGLALLIDWLACAQAAGRRLRYGRLPPALLALAKLSDVAPLLEGAPSGGAPALNPRADSGRELQKG